MAAPDTYMTEMHQRFGFLATWLPNTPIQIGDVGVLRRDRFEHITTLRRLGVNFQSSTANKMLDLEYTSEGCVETEFSAGASRGNNSPKGEASVRLRFLRENAVLFVASSCAPVQLDNIREIGKQILDLYQEGTWEHNWAVVTQILDAEASTILISEQVSAELTLAAEQSLNGTLKSLADTKAGLHVRSGRGVGLRIVAAGGLRPLFQAHGVKKRLFSANRFERQARPNSLDGPQFVQFRDEDRL
jgi:hypothetical protein